MPLTHVGTSMVSDVLRCCKLLASAYTNSANDNYSGERPVTNSIAGHHAHSSSILRLCSLRLIALRTVVAAVVDRWSISIRYIISMEPLCQLDPLQRGWSRHAGQLEHVTLENLLKVGNRTSFVSDWNSISTGMPFTYELTWNRNHYLWPGSPGLEI